MVITFLKLKLHNFMSFADTELDLNDMGSILVTGRNYCKIDNAYSNGSGKSSIFNGICYALTGETSQGISSGIENIFTNPDDCWVELTFEADGDLFVIKRISTPKSDMKLTINGIDRSGKGIRESSKLLATYLPDLTSELISSAIILGQGLPYRFSNNKPSHRKELLEKLTKSDFMIQSIKDKLELRQTELKDSLRVKEDSLIGIQSQKEVYDKQFSKLEDQLKEYDELTSESSLYDLIDNAKKDLEISKKEIETFTEESSKLETEIIALTDSKAKVTFEENEKLHLKLKDFDSAISDYTSLYSDKNSEIRVLKNEIQKLDSITDICPTCGQKIPDVNKPDTTEQKEHLKVLEEEAGELKKSLDDLKLKRSDVISDNSEAILAMTEEIDSQITDLKDELSQTKKTLSDYNNCVLDLTNKLTRYENARANYDKIIEEQQEISNKILYLDEQADELELGIVNIKSHLDVVQQMLTLAKREFRGILLSNIIEFINKKVKQYSLAVFGTTELNFALNENCIDITYNDKMYENMSGGEKQKIDIIIQLALRDILSKQLNIHTNILVCDEIYDNMDSISCQKITNLISTLTDISSIFIISHHAQDLEITYDSNLLVEKDENGISSISFV